MKFDYIFEPYLLSVIYADRRNSYYDIVRKWNSLEYIFNFYRQNEVLIKSNKYIRCRNGQVFMRRVIQESIKFDKRLIECAEKENFETLFEPLRLEVKEPTVARQKGKQSLLRLYALKIEYNKFLITGGAIKITQKMEDHPSTKEELLKLNRYQLELKANGVIDSDSFYEYINSD